MENIKTENRQHSTPARHVMLEQSLSEPSHHAATAKVASTNPRMQKIPRSVNIVPKVTSLQARLKHAVSVILASIKGAILRVL